jgi:hypothetical protein
LETSIGTVSKTSILMTKIFLCKCPNVSIINLNIVPNLYKICIQSWSKLLELIQLCNNDIVTILKKIYIFCNSTITFQHKPIMLTSFLQSNLRTINDILDSNNLNFKSLMIYTITMVY